MPFNWRTPNAQKIGLAALMGTCATVGHWLVILAYTAHREPVSADVSKVAASDIRRS